MSRDIWRELTRTGSDTTMGQLLRRYWWPIAGLSHLENERLMPVRLMGENLVLFLDASGQAGLISRRCPHRGADMLNGITEQGGLRCAYHGWMFDRMGSRVDAPYEETLRPGFCARHHLSISAYPVRQLGGMIWAYLGPAPAPELPEWEFFSWENGFRQIVTADVPCNWLQCQENSIDPVHFEWLHSNFSLRRNGTLHRYSPKHIRLGFDEFEYGFIYRRLRESTSESDPLWQVGRVCLWPNAVFTGNHVEYRVPVDDEHTLSIAWHFSRVPKEREPYNQKSIPTWHGPVVDEHGRPIVTHINNQDFAAWIGQGPIVDRSLENLGASDEGIIRLRKRLLADLRELSEGKDPKGVIRDPGVSKNIPLPTVDREQLTAGCTLGEMIANPDLLARLREFIFQTGQPESVRKEYVDAMGIDGVELPDHGPVDFLARSQSK